ncbi:MAG: NIF domain [Lasallia pustulata]|uniref:NIF domain n=1 Tax=Lasallia pustulata TaxID=136370 RepID=A0A5M8PM22_9LECA|nr:MAG: NIF domain [Lasallia pustulata]
MNSLNILSARVIGQAPPQTPSTLRSRGQGDTASELGESDEDHDQQVPIASGEEKDARFVEDEDSKEEDLGVTPVTKDEKTPLLDERRATPFLDPKRSKLRIVAKQLVDALTESLRWVLSTIAAPGVYVVTCFYDDNGRFSPFLPLRKLRRAVPTRNGSSSTAQAMGLSGSLGGPDESSDPTKKQRSGRRKVVAVVERPKFSSAGSFSSTASESEANSQRKEANGGSSKSSRSKSQVRASSENATPTRRSVRIKVYNEDTARQRKDARKHKHGAGSVSSTGSDASQAPAVTAATLKSPTSPTSSLRMTKYPRAPAPPRPLIPPRQPSYSTHTSPHSSILAQKTLVIDLDETLIHSLAKGGRMSSGHMVEVKLNTTVGIGGTTLGPQHPILYYVHKRPHCDEFLRKVCKWYNLVAFTASVQEYADPVIDWLEQERKYFSGRYYRQHCTYRNSAYIKDLSSVEPDLSRVMILDNSPLSYIFHEDNAIPIEGWINDPTDNDLLHLIPVLEALQYVTDVRALLALRRGEAEASH